MFAAQIDNAIETLIFETRDQGGSTRSARGDMIPTTGYMVGGVVESLYFDAMLIRDPGHWRTAYQMIMRWVNENFARATQVNTFLGGWIDTEENIAYVDLSQHFTDLRAALSMARLNDEIAIWDLKNGKEIRVVETVNA